MHSRLASRSQAKFQTTKSSPLSAPCAAAPAQSTVSTCRSLRFSPRSCADVSLNMHCPSGLPKHIWASKRRQFVAAVTLISRSQVWMFVEVAFGQEIAFISSPVSSRACVDKMAEPKSRDRSSSTESQLKFPGALTIVGVMTTTTAASSVV